jgi:hypothetical protein
VVRLSVNRGSHPSAHIENKGFIARLLVRFWKYTAYMQSIRNTRVKVLWLPKNKCPWGCRRRLRRRKGSGRRLEIAWDKWEGKQNRAGEKTLVTDKQQIGNQIPEMDRALVGES